MPIFSILCFLAWCWVAVRPNFAWDDAEPEILNQAWRFAQGKEIYRGIENPPYTFAAYTPVYYVTAGLIMKITGLNYLPAKLLSFFAALSIGFAFVRLNRHWNGPASGGLWAAAFLFLIPAFLYNAVRSHVQMMAVAFSIWSLVFFVRNRYWQTVFISPIFAVLAFYTKQTQVALPIALALYLALRNRRWLLPYAATGIVAALIPFFWLQRVTDGNLLFDTVNLARLAYSVPDIPLVFLHHAGPICLFLGVALVEAWLRVRSRSWTEVDLYLVIVFGTTVVSLGRLGAHGQYVLELLAVALLYLMKVKRLPEIPGKDALVAAQILLLFVYTPCFIFLEEGLWDRAANRAAGRIYPMLDSNPGPILSQQGSFALFSHGEIYVQLFHFCALSRAGMWDQQLLVRDIDRHKFPWVITEFPIEESGLSSTDRERFTPEILDALRAGYRLREAIYPYFIYAPRR